MTTSVHDYTFAGSLDLPSALARSASSAACDKPRLRVSITAAPAAAPASAASAAAEANAAPLPLLSTMRGYCSGGVTFFIRATWWMGLVKPTPFSLQPMHG